MAINEPKALLQEEEADAMLAAMEKLEIIGFRVGVTRYRRDREQSSAVFRIVKELKLSAVMQIVCTVTLEKHHQGPKIKTKVALCEYTGSASGKSELMLEIDENREYLLSSQIGNTASNRVKEVCATLKIDRLTVIKSQKIEKAYGEIVLRVIAALQSGASTGGVR